MNLFPRYTKYRLQVILIASVVAGGCASPQPPASLFDRLGGMPVITAVVDKEVDAHAADPRTRRTFSGVNLKTLKASIVSMTCAATGGPCKYTGEPRMANAHKGLAITSEEFDVSIDQIRDALDELHVAAREKKELLGILIPMKADIVGR
jgi:hemoglobin